MKISLDFFCGYRQTDIGNDLCSGGDLFRKGEIFRGKKYYHHQYEKCDDHFVASFGNVLPKKVEIIMPRNMVYSSFAATSLLYET